jgi:hypothetical protein
MGMHRASMNMCPAAIWAMKMISSEISSKAAAK